MSWPLSHDYNQAVQVPRLAFSDPDLKAGIAAAGANGLPLPRTGNFADVYEVHAADGRPWAVKCFTRPVVGLDHRYAAVSAALAAADLPFTVGFTFLADGVRVGGKWFPAVKMEWVEGLLVNQFVRDNADKPAALDGLLRLWARLCKRLREAGIAHGDLQHGNVLLVPGSKPGAVVLKLIDYDGMYVPALANNPSGESGHPAFQHPARAATRGYSPDIDRFPHLVVATALAGLKVLGAELWHRYDTGDNLLFTEADFRNPAGSRVMRDIWQTCDADAQALVGNLALACLRPIPQTAWLDHIAPDGRPIPLPSDWRDAAAAALGLSESVPVESATPQPPSHPTFDLDSPEPSARKRAFPFNPLAVGAAVAVVGAAVVTLVLLTDGGTRTAQTPPPDAEPKTAPADADPTPPPPDPLPPEVPTPPAPNPPVVALAKRAVAPAPRPVPPPADVPDVIPPPRAVERRPVPLPADQAQAEARIRLVLKDDYARKTPAERRALARKLIGLAEETTGDPPARYVLLRDARDIAVAAADPAAAAMATDGLGRWFAVEADALKLAALEQIVAAPPAAGVLRAVADVALPAADAAAGADDFEAAIKYADLAARAAKKGALGAGAVEDGEFRAAHAKAAREAFAEVRPAADALAANPDDPAANLALGKYRCFAQTRWDIGLAHLAKGADPRLKALAALDLDEPRAGVADVKLADAWWDYARAAPDAEKRAADARARYWYGRALSGLNGLTKAQAENRLGFELNGTVYRPGLLAEFATRPPAALKSAKARIDPGVEFSTEGFAELRKGVELTVKWTGVIAPPRPGRYRLTVTTADPVKVTVGGKTVIDTITTKGGRKDATVTLTERPAAVVVELHTVLPERNTPRRLKLGWTPPLGPAEDVIPPEYLFHDRKTAAAVPP